MPKVPAAPGIAPLPVPNVGRVVDTGMGDVGRALSGAGDVFTKIADDVAREEAALQVSAWEDGLEAKKTELGWDDQKGLFHKKDERAYAAGDDVRAMNEFRSFAESSVGKLPSKRARDEAAAKLAGHVNGWNRSIETHVGDQRRSVKMKTYERRLGLLADLIQGDPLNDVEIDKRTADLDSLAQALSIPEAVRGKDSDKVAALRAEAQIDRSIKLGDMSAAREFFERDKAKLGPAAGRISERIIAEEQNAKVKELSTLVIESSPSTLNPEGKWVDEPAARRRFVEEVSKRELTIEERRLAETVFENDLQARRATRDNDVKALWNRIRGASAETGSLLSADQGDLATLKRWDGELYARLWDAERNRLADAESRYDRRLARKDAAAARAARNDDRLWITRYLSLPTKQRAETDVAREFVGRVSDLGMAEIERHRTLATEAMGRGDDVTEAEFLRYARGVAGPTVGRSDEERFTAAALLAWQSARSTKGAELNEKEKAGLVSDVLFALKKESHFGGLYTTEVPGYRTFGPGSTIPPGVVRPAPPLVPPKWLRTGPDAPADATIVAPDRSLSSPVDIPAAPLSSVEPPAPSEPTMTPADQKERRAVRARELKRENPTATHADILEQLKAEGLYDAP